MGKGRSISERASDGLKSEAPAPADSPIDLEASSAPVPAPDIAAAPDLGRISVVVEGSAARDPLLRRSEDTGPARVPLRTWAKLSGMRPTSLAGFAVWAARHAPGERTAGDWQQLLAEYQRTPAK